MVVKLRKEASKEDVIDNFRPICLLNVGLEILDNGLAKCLARVVGGIVREVQTCALPGSMTISTL